MKFVFILLILSAAIVVHAQLPNEIVFTGEDRIYLVRADGSEQTPITSPAVGTQRPRWSRDGRQIVFLTGFTCSDSPSGLWKINADGANQRPVELGLSKYAPAEAVFRQTATGLFTLASIALTLSLLSLLQTPTEATEFK